MARKPRAPIDTGEHEEVTASHDEVGLLPPGERKVTDVPKSKNKTKFDTSTIMEAAHPDYGATVYTDLVRLTGYSNDASFRTRVSQLINSGRLDKKFRPEKPSKKSKVEA